MAMEITSNWNNYMSGYAAKQAADSARAGEAKEAEKAERSQAGKTDGKNDYLKKLQKQVPAMTLKAGEGFASAEGRITQCISVNPKLLEKMENDPETAKKTTQLLKDIERASKLGRSYFEAKGNVEYLNDQWYVDENGNHSHFAQIIIRDRQNERLRKEAEEKTKEHIEKLRENAKEKYEELTEKLEEQKAEKADERKGEAQKAAEEMLDKKLSESKDGIFHLYKTDVDILLAADDEVKGVPKEEKSSEDTPKTGTNIDIQA